MLLLFPQEVYPCRLQRLQSILSQPAFGRSHSFKPLVCNSSVSSRQDGNSSPTPDQPRNNSSSFPSSRRATTPPCQVPRDCGIDPSWQTYSWHNGKCRISQDLLKHQEPKLTSHSPTGYPRHSPYRPRFETLPSQAQETMGERASIHHRGNLRGSEGLLHRAGTARGDTCCFDSLDLLAYAVTRYAMRCNGVIET